MTSSPGPGSPRSSDAEALFDGFLARHGEQDDVAFARFCASHPEQAARLTRLRDVWRSLGGAVDDLGRGFPDDAPDAIVSGARDDARPRDDDHRDRGSAPSADPTRADSLDRTRRPSRAPDSPSDDDLDLSDAEARVDPGRPSPSVDDTLRHLSSREPDFRSDREIGRGAMGRILRVWDGRLRRSLAMKVLLDRDADPLDPGRDATRQRRLSRFLDEAQITGQLDHPGIVPVHELGLDADGRLYFTMRLVRGQSFRAILDLVRDGTDGWTVPRALGVVQKVCEAMAYAHSKGVLHRDIKPSNVMVGRFGETYVMDWGLAKVLGRPEPAAPQLPSRADLVDHAGASASEIRTLRREHDERAADSPLQTLAGTVVGTPAYMAPEQALGSLEVVGPTADVYAVGAMLYHLLAGRMPYVRDDERPTPGEVLLRVRSGPPRPLHTIHRRQSAELVAICERAMARDPSDRYVDMTAMADDLRAFLEGRVVRSYEAGALAELRKWVVRNRAFAAVIALALVALAALTVWLYDLSEERRRQSLVIGDQLQTARELEQQAVDAQRAAESAASVADQARDAAEASALAASRNAFAASIAAAESALDNGDLTEARRLLAACAPDQRGWEWEHLALRVDPSLAVLRGHDQPVTALAFAPDDNLIASAGRDGTLRLWDSDDGQPGLVLQTGDASLAALAFHPGGELLASAGGSDRIDLWSLPSGESRGALRVAPALAPEPRPRVTCLAYGPLGDRLYAGTDQSRVVALDARSGRRQEFPRLHGGALTALAVSADGRLLASASEDRSAALWDTASAELRSNLFGHDGAVRALALDPLDQLVATGADDGQVRLFNLADGRLALTLAAHDEPVTGLAFAPGGDLLVSASADRSARLWDPYGGRLLATLHGHDEPLTAIRFDHSGSRLASASTDGTARLWDSGFQGALTWLHGHTDRVESLAVSPRDELLVSAGWDGRALLWDVDTASPLAARDLSAAAAVVAFAPDGSAVATADTTPGPERSHAVSLWDESLLADLDATPRRLHGHGQAVSAVAFSADGSLLASTGRDGRVLLRDTTDGVLRHDLDHGAWVHALDFHPDGELLASAGHDGSLHLWSLDDGGPRARWDSDGVSLFTVVFSPDGELLAVGGANGLLQLLDGRDLSPLRVLPGHHDDVAALSFHPTKARLASASRDGTVRLWETGGGLRLLSLRHRVAPADLAFSADGARLFVAVGPSIAVHETRGPATTWVLRQRQLMVGARATALVQERLDTLVDPRAVRSALAADDSLEPALRDEALRQARNFGDDPLLLAEAAWSVLLDPHAGPQEHRDARRQARAAERLGDGNAWLTSLVGLAHFRCGDDRLALRVLERSHQANRLAPSHPLCWDLFVIAMAHQRLGSVNQARVFLDQARLEAELGDGEGRETTLALASEARRLIEGGGSR